MKNKLVLGLIGIGGIASSALAQGVISGNYTSSGAIGSPITYAANNVPVGKAGLAIGSEFSGELLYFTGGNYVAIPSSLTAFNATDGDVANGAGYQVGAFVDIPGWSSGSVSVEWMAYNTVAIGSFTVGSIVGVSTPFTITPLTDPNPNSPDFSTTSFAPFTVSAVPEPATLALAGLGGLASLIMLRRKQA